MKYLTLTIFFLFPFVAFGAIAYTSATTYDTASFLFSHTLNVTGCDATDDGVILAIHQRNPVAEITATPTVDASAMTLEASSVNANVTGTQIYSFINPDNNFDVVVETSSYKTMAFSVLCLSGVDQTDMVEATSTDSGYASSVSLSLTTLTDGAMIVTGINTQNDSAGMTPEASFNETSDFSSASGSIGQGGSGYQAVATAGAETTGWSFTTDNYTIASASVKPAAGGGGTSVDVTDVFYIDYE